MMKNVSNFNIGKKSKYLSNVHKIEGAYLQCVNNHYAKFEYKGTKTFGVTDYTNLAPKVLRSDGGRSGAISLKRRR